MKWVLQGVLIAYNYVPRGYKFSWVVFFRCVVRNPWIFFTRIIIITIINDYW